MWWCATTPLRAESLLSVNPEDQESIYATLVPWNGTCSIPGAYIMTRLNLKDFEIKCKVMVNEISTAFQVINILAKVKLMELDETYIQRIGYLLLTIESKFNNIIKYVDALHVCYDSTMDLIHTEFHKFQIELDTMWQLLKRHKPPNRSLLMTLLTDANITLPGNVTNSTSFIPRRSPISVSLLNTLEQARPKPPPKQFIVAAGLLAAFTGGALISQLIAGDDNSEAIDMINTNLRKQNNNIQLTNERIDILTANVTEAFDKVQTVLQQINTYSRTRDKTSALLFNLDQLIERSDIQLLEFKSQLVNIALLKKGIINPDNIDITSVEKIMSEGLNKFPTLYFPLEIIKENLYDIVGMMKVSTLYENSFLITLPLFKRDIFVIFSLIAHPVKLSDESDELVLPEMERLLLINNVDETYITTTEKNIVNIRDQHYTLQHIRPIQKQYPINTCEMAGYVQNISLILASCQYKKLSSPNGFYFYETKQVRLAYFAKPTRVSLVCPDHKIKDNLVGMHRVPPNCELGTETITWPARQVHEVSIADLTTVSLKPLDPIKLPIIDINDTKGIHQSLKKIIDDIVPSGNQFTIDFEALDLDMEEVQSISVIAYGTLSVIVMINSVLLGLIGVNKLRKIIKNKRNLKELTTFSPRDSFRRARDSIKARQARVKDRLNALTPPRSPREWARKLKTRLDKFDNKQDVGTSTIDFDLPELSNNNLDSPDENDVSLYPVIPRY